MDVVSVIKEYVQNYKNMKGTETEWREPVIGIANASNDGFADLKYVIGDSHALPSDFIDDAQSVIVFFLLIIIVLIPGIISKARKEAHKTGKISTN